MLFSARMKLVSVEPCSRLEWILFAARMTPFEATRFTSYTSLYSCERVNEVLLFPDPFQSWGGCTKKGVGSTQMSLLAMMMMIARYNTIVVVIHICPGGFFLCLSFGLT